MKSKKENWKAWLPKNWRKEIAERIDIKDVKQISYHLSTRSRNYIMKEKILREMKNLARESEEACQAVKDLQQ